MSYPSFYTIKFHLNPFIFGTEDDKKNRLKMMEKKHQASQGAASQFACQIGFDS